MIFTWRRKGLRGAKLGVFLTESLFMGIVLVTSVYIGVSIMAHFALRQSVSERVLSGLTVLFVGGFQALLASGVLADFLLFVMVLYSTAFLAAVLLDFIEEKRRLSLKQESALDVQFKRIRRKKKVPRIVIEERGRRTEGICRVYTFTEPREVLLETRDPDGNIYYVWRKIDDEVSTVFVYEEDPPKKDEKVISFLDRLKKTR